MAFCSKCGKELQDENFCPFCGTSAKKQDESNLTEECPFCGTKVSVNATICPGCDAQKGNKADYMFISILMMAGIILGIIIFFVGIATKIFFISLLGIVFCLMGYIGFKRSSSSKNGWKRPLRHI
jgi:hypothetical protein